jgi:RNA polymerase sigma-70 factor, ECF subfamily
VVEYVKKAQRGDRDAFIKLIESKKSQMYKTALMQLNSSTDALDAVQESILIAFERIYTLKEPEHFNTWLIRILLNQCHDIQRERKKVIPIEEVYEGKDNENYCKDFEKIELKEMMKSLDGIYRTVLDLRYNEDMKVEDIARTLEIPAGTVKSRINKALKLLRRQFEDVMKGGEKL